MSKACTDCSQVLPLDEFHSAGGSKRRGRCKRCSAIEQAARRARKDPAEHDYGTKQVPAGYRIKGVTQLLDSEGKIRSQHVKTEREPEVKADKRTEMLEALRGMLEPFKGCVDPVAEPEHPAEDLLLMLPIGDAHVGLECHADETGEDFNLEIQERNHMAAVDGLLSVAPNAEEGLVVNVGDYLHSDNARGNTTKGTSVDQHGNRHKVLLIAMRMFRRTIDAALLKCKRVTVVTATGNHDGESAGWIRICLATAYEREPRVIILAEPTKFHWHRFGKCLFGVTHGDTCKPADLPIIMACDRPEDWAATEHRIWVTGHLHHTVVKELHGCTHKVYRTLAAQDKWHKGQGYRSGRDLRLEVWHKEKGQIQEFIHGVMAA